MKVSLDDGETWQPADNGVRVYFDLRPNPDDSGGTVELQVNCTREGIILDVWTKEGRKARNLGTSSELVADIIERLTAGSDE